MKLTTVDDIVLYEFKSYHEGDGTLIPVEAMIDLPIPIKRVFYVLEADGKKRGNHAHYQSKQVLTCPVGTVIVKCHDGINEKEFILNRPTLALYIPTMIWDSTIYEDHLTMLLAFSDTLYDPSDYINDFDEFLKLKSDRRKNNSE